MTIEVTQPRTRPTKIKVRRGDVDIMKFEIDKEYREIRFHIKNIYKSWLKIKLAKLIYKINK